jgi:hypothetical protein
MASLIARTDRPLSRSALPIPTGGPPKIPSAMPVVLQPFCVNAIPAVDAPTKGASNTSRQASINWLVTVSTGKYATPSRTSSPNIRRALSSSRGNADSCDGPIVTNFTSDHPFRASRTLRDKC